jgi:5-methylcytosine-specific restriction endonuclease McrA
MPRVKGVHCAYKGCEGCVFETGCVGTSVCMPYRKLQHTAHYEANREAYIANTKQYHLDHPEVRTSPEYKARVALYKANHKVERFVQGTILNHKDMGFDVQVTYDELIAIVVETSTCKYCGEEIDYTSGGHRMNGPSMDRVENGSVITKDNVAVICRRCNANKGARSHEEFVDYAAMVLNRMSNE